jgi:hypothetical protein
MYRAMRANFVEKFFRVGLVATGYGLSDWSIRLLKWVF